MRSIEGVVTIVQETRFQLLDDDGVGHHFLLAYSAAIEPEQLPMLTQRRVRVTYTDPIGVICHQASKVMSSDNV